MKQWASVLFLAVGPWWAPECLHYSQETEHQHILQGTIKEVRGQPWVNTFRAATRWRHGDLSPKMGNVAQQLTVSAKTAALCVVYTVGWRETELWPVMLSILLWQQVRLTRQWGEAETLRCTVCLCSQVTKVKQHLTGAQYSVFMDADVTWVSLKNGVSGFLVRHNEIERNTESLNCWCMWPAV